MMDFGQAPEEKPKKRRKLKIPKKTIAICLGILIVAGLMFGYVAYRSQSPLPENIKSQISYKAVYPSSSLKLSSSGYQYKNDQKSFTFTINAYDTSIIFAEQPAPSSLGTGNQVYFPALGIHPYAQFQSKLGPVALTKFYKPGTLEPLGETGVLVAQGTLVIAHPEKNLTNEQWKALINSLKITK